jgi:hypothetical protein
LRCRDCSATSRSLSGGEMKSSGSTPVTTDMSKGACGISHARGDTEHKISSVIFHVKYHMCIYIATIPLHSNL